MINQILRKIEQWFIVRDFLKQKDFEVHYSETLEMYRLENKEYTVTFASYTLEGKYGYMLLKVKDTKKEYFIGTTTKKIVKHLKHILIINEIHQFLINLKH